MEKSLLIDNLPFWSLFLWTKTCWCFTASRVHFSWKLQWIVWV